MTDPISLPFEMNQGQLPEAIAAAMPGLIANLAVEFTNGRPPKGLTAQVVVSEAQIREAVIAHAKRLVNPQFRHFAISFKATRGDDGMTTSIIASTHPIDEAPVPTSAATPVAEPKPSPLKEPEPTPAATAPEPETASEGEASAPVTTDPAPVEEVTTADVVEDEKTAPWEDDGSATSAEATPATEAAAAPVETEAAPATAETDEAAKPAPAAGRSRLFADLQRPKND